MGGFLTSKSGVNFSSLFYTVCHTIVVNEGTLTLMIFMICPKVALGGSILKTHESLHLKCE